MAAAKATTDFRNNNFDLLRILAATQVLVMHSMARFGISVPEIQRPLGIFPGVPIFFVISGYLVSASFERQTCLRTYFKNRFLRIFPGLWACLAVTAVVVLAFGFRPAGLTDFLWLPSQFLSLIFTPPFLKSFGVGSYNGSLWTIPVELQFYFVLPLVYMVIRRKAGSQRALVGMIGFFLAIRLVLNVTHPLMGVGHETGFEKVIRYSFVPHFFMFLLGVLMQRLQAHRSKWIAGKGLVWVALYAAVAMAIPTHPAFQSLAFILMAIASISVAYTLPGIAHRILKGEDVSYGVYVYHGLVINIVLTMKRHFVMTDVLVVLVSAYVLGSLSWFFVEKPFLRKKKKKVESAAVSQPELVAAAVAAAGQ